MTQSQSRQQAPEGPHPREPDIQHDPSVGELVHRLTGQVPALVRSEVRLAQLELADKGKRAGLGAGLFGAAGIIAFLGLAGLVTAAILGLAEVMPAWGAALVVSAVLLTVAAVAAALGRTSVKDATPVKPELAMDGVRRDLAAIKGGKA